MSFLAFEQCVVRAPELQDSGAVRIDLPATGQALLDAAAFQYTDRVGECGLVVLEQEGAHYLFDLASPESLPQEDRTVAAWALTPAVIESRDTSYQRGFPMVPSDGTADVDRGHLIPHLSGGKFGPNIYRQDRALNRGWSAGGRYRALERLAASRPGILFFGHLVYGDDTAFPMWVELAVLTIEGTLASGCFPNRPDAGRDPESTDPGPVGL